MNSHTNEIDDAVDARLTIKRLLEEERYDEIISFIEKPDIAVELVKFIENPDDDIRENAAETIGRIGKNDARTPDIIIEKILPHLLPLLGNPNPNIRCAATRALTNIAWNWVLWDDIHVVIEPAIPRLIDLLNDPDVKVRKNAIEGIQVVSELIEDKAADIRQLEPALPSIVRYLEEEELRSCAIWSLRAISHKNPEMIKPFISNISKFIHDTKEHVRLGAIITLKNVAKIEPELIQSLRSDFAALLEDSDSRIRQNAAIVLGFIAPEVPEIADRIMPQLIELLDDRRSTTRREAVEAIARIAKANPEAATVAKRRLVELLEGQDESVRKSSESALKHLADNSTNSGNENL